MWWIVQTYGKWNGRRIKVQDKWDTKSYCKKKMGYKIYPEEKKRNVKFLKYPHLPND